MGELKYLCLHKLKTPMRSINGSRDRDRVGFSMASIWDKGHGSSTTVITETVVMVWEWICWYLYNTISGVSRVLNKKSQECKFCLTWKNSHRILEASTVKFPKEQTRGISGSNDWKLSCRGAKGSLKKGKIIHMIIKMNVTTCLLLITTKCAVWLGCFAHKLLQVLRIFFLITWKTRIEQIFMNASHNN